MIQGLCYGIYPESSYWQPLLAKDKATWSQPQCENERQQSVNNFVCCILCHPRAVVRLLSIIEVSATFLGNMVIVDVPSPDNERQQCVNRASTQHQQSINRVSTEHQQSWVLHLVESKGCAKAFTQNQRIGSLYGYK